MDLREFSPVALSHRFGPRRRALLTLAGLFEVIVLTIWLGSAGFGLGLLYVAASWPRWSQRQVSLHWQKLSRAWLYVGATGFAEYRTAPVWIFPDELPAVEYVALRRALKAQISELL